MPQDQANAYIQVVFFVILIAAFYLFILRPQKQRSDEHIKFISRLKVGDKVVSIGGIHGTIKGVNAKTIELTIASGVIITINKGAIAAMFEESEKIADNTSQPANNA